MTYRPIHDRQRTRREVRRIGVREGRNRAKSRLCGYDLCAAGYHPRAGTRSSTPLSGSAASIAMGMLGERLRGRDVASGTFCRWRWDLAFSSCTCTPRMPPRRRQFSSATCWASVSGWCGRFSTAVSLCALAAIARPLLFATLAPELAEAKGVSLRFISVLLLVQPGRPALRGRSRFGASGLLGCHVLLRRPRAPHAAERAPAADDLGQWQWGTADVSRPAQRGEAIGTGSAPEL